MATLLPTILMTFSVQPCLSSILVGLTESGLERLLLLDDFWLLRLTLILLGYASVLIPGYLFVKYIKYKWQENEPYFQQDACLNLIRKFAVGQPEYSREHKLCKWLPFISWLCRFSVPTESVDESKDSVKEDDYASPPSFMRRCGLLLMYSTGIQITLISMGFFQER